DDPATQVAGRTVYSDYTPFLDADALRGARLGIAFSRGGSYYNALNVAQRAIIDAASDVMRKRGAQVFLVEIQTADALATFNSSVLQYEFKRDLNAYLTALPSQARVHSLTEVIAFNNAYWDQYRLRYGQSVARASDT